MNGDDFNIQISRTDGGVCERCGALSDEMYAVTAFQNGQNRTFRFCRNCTAAAKRLADRKRQEAASWSAEAAQPVQPAQPPQPVPPMQPEAANAPGLTAKPPAAGKKKRKKTALLIAAAVSATVIIVTVVAAIAIGLEHARADQPDISSNYEAHVDPAAQDAPEDVPAADQTPTETVPKKPSGIISVSVKRSNIDIHCIDPETGDAVLVSSFSISHFNISSSSGGVYQPSGVYDPTRRVTYSSDFQKLAFHAYTTNGAHRYPYWIDSDGNFVNVYERVFGVPGDFESKIKCFTYGFDQNDYYYFKVEKNEETRYYRVSSADLSTDSLEDLTDTITNSRSHENNIYNLMFFNHSDHIVFGDGPMSMNKFWHISSWIDDVRYYRNDFRDSDLYTTATGGIFYEDLTPPADHISKAERILEVDGRESFDAMISPDKQRIAFISWIDGEWDASLFIAGTKGENPQKVNTDITFNVMFDCYGTTNKPIEKWWAQDRSDYTYLLAWV